MNKIVAIKDMEGVCKKIRNKVYKYLEIKVSDYEYVTLKQISSLIKQNSLGLNEDDRYLINQEILDNISYTVEQMVVGFMLAQDLANGDMDCYWDDKYNDLMIL